MAGFWLALKTPYYGVPLPLVSLAVAVPAWLAITKRTGLALAVVLVYIGLFDGVIKLKTGGQAATLGRDVVLYAVAVGMLARAQGPLRRPAFAGWVVAWALVIVVQLANPANGSVAHSLASLRQHLEFLPLFFIGYAALRTRASLHAFFAILLAVAALNGAVAAYQGSLTPEQLAAWGPGYDYLVNNPEAGRVFDGADGKPRVRPPGLGSDMGFGGTLGMTALPGGIALVMSYWRRRWPLAFALLGIVGAGAGVLTSQSRSCLITTIVALFAMLVLLALGRQAKRAVIAVCIAAAIATTAVLAIESYDSGTFHRYNSIVPSKAASTTYDARAVTWATTPEYIGRFPLGAGLGSVGPAATKIGGEARELNAESQFNFLVVEAGIPGLVAFLAFQAALCGALVTRLRRERDPRNVVLMAGLAAPLFGFAAGWLVGVNTTSPPNAPYIWLAAGVIGWWLVDRHAAMRRASSARSSTNIVSARRCS